MKWSATQLTKISGESAEYCDGIRVSRKASRGKQRAEDKGDSGERVLDDEKGTICSLCVGGTLYIHATVDAKDHVVPPHSICTQLPSYESWAFHQCNSANFSGSRLTANRPWRGFGRNLSRMTRFKVKTDSSEYFFRLLIHF
jgi:hypothetical protein